MDVYKPRYTCLLIFIVCCLATQVYSQATKPLDKTITLAQKSVRLDTIFKVITRETGIRFSYNSRRLNASYKLKIQATTLTVQQLLDELKRKTGVLYTVIGNQVVLNIEKSIVQQPAKAEDKPVTKPEPARSLTPPSDSAAKQINHQNIQDTMGVTREDSLSAIVHSALLPVTDRIKPVQDSSQMRVPQPQLPKQPTDSVQKPKSDAVTKKSSSIKKRNYFAELGLNVEETLFTGITLRAGIPKVFASVSLGTNGKSIIVLYGLGTSVKIKDQSRLLIGVQYGSVSKNFTYKQSADSVTNTYAIAVKNNWIRTNVGIEWMAKPKSRISFYAGVNLNALQSRYSVADSTSGLAAIPVSNPEKRFSAFYPFYTLTNSYTSRGSDSWKTWLGLQFSIRYRFFYR